MDYTSITMTFHYTHQPGKIGLKMIRNIRWILVSLACLLFLAACAPQVQPVKDIAVTVTADGSSHPVHLPAGSTVQQALEAASVTLASTDRVDPSTFTVLSGDAAVVVTRVREEFETRQIIVPFERQELRNESLPSGETRLVQAGQNGLDEITIRHVFENNVETGSSTVSETLLQPAVPEIVMIGVQSPFAPITIPGKLAYRTTDGNAWLIDGSTSNRRPLITSGDIDGRIFSLSPDGAWLLFTRKSNQPPDQQINTLWAVSTTAQSPAPVNLGVANIVHFADWQPGETYKIAYSTVEPHAGAPGWDANNDLHILAFENGKPGKTRDILDTNYGGVYPWWGMSFAWSPDGSSLAYSRPDGVGLADIGASGLTTLLDITPYNTRSDWAWTSSLAWSNDSQTLYLVTHVPSSGLVAPEDSPNFDLVALSLPDRARTTLVPSTGMYAYPAVSSLRQGQDGATTWQVAYLQALFPTSSANSRYRLVVMDKKGANSRSLFPAEGQPGLELTQAPVWAPRLLDNGSDLIGFIYAGNLWIVDAASGLSQQVTGDGLTSNLAWK
jgi:resuscitation-promoting factor RpfB